MAIRLRLESTERRRAIVAAAMPLFARKGFDGTTTKEIARAAGVSEALVFQHFPSKAALYHEILGQGCEGDPALERLRQLAAVDRDAGHHDPADGRALSCSGALGDAEECELHQRLVVQSYLHDGEYARLAFAWCAEEIWPLFRESLAAAREAGDLEVEAAAGADVNGFWFGHHVAAAIAWSRLAGADVLPYAGGEAQLMRDATRFILRGLGLREAAIRDHLEAGPPDGA